MAAPILPSEEIIEFWFNGCQKDPGLLPERLHFWFASDHGLDNTIEQRFGCWLEPVARHKVQSRQRPLDCLAAILVLDQFSRHCFRGRAKAFAYDAQALGLLKSAIQRKWDEQLAGVESMFMYMPLQHSENIDDQRLGISLYQQLLQRVPEAYQSLVQGSLNSAREHCELILRFGRFPHRNQVLQRRPSAQEVDYLEAGGKRFGQ